MFIIFYSINRYAYKDKIAKYHLRQFETLSQELGNILTEIKSKKNSEKDLEFFEDKQKEMEKKCKELEVCMIVCNYI